MAQSNSLAIILAAGKGTRMNAKLPKPLVKVNSRPIVSWLIDDFKHNNIDVAIVINPLDKQFFNRYEGKAKLIFQKNQRGTGHAVMQASNLIKHYKYVYVFVGDSPFVGSANILLMSNRHIKDDSDMTILSSIFNEKKFPYARIIRNDQGNITGCIEEIDATDEQKNIKELFCSHYIFKTKILQEYLNRLNPNPKTEEIYFTDIINELILDKKNISSLIVDDWKRLVGLNTKEELKWIESQKLI